MHLVGSSVAGAAVVAAGARALQGSSDAAELASVGDWHVAEVGAVDRGALPFLLENRNSGERLRVEACRRGARLEPVARSAEFDLFLANQGDGAAQTTRTHQIVARALARRLDADGARAPVGVTSLEARHAAHRDLFSTADDPANA